MFRVCSSLQRQCLTHSTGQHMHCCLRWNGRLAMLGLVILLAVETFKVECFD